MNNLEHIANCRMVFYIAISLYSGDFISVDDELENYMRDFSIDKLEEYYDEIKSLYCYEYKNGKYTFSRPDELMNIVYEKMDKIKNPNVITKIYDDVGFEKTQKLTNFAVLLCDYINMINSEDEWTLKQ